MLIVKYNGGLGNQIFQYVFGVSKAKELGAKLSFDMSFFKKHSKKRPYMMGIFGVEVKENKDFPHNIKEIEKRFVIICLASCQV